MTGPTAAPSGSSSRSWKVPIRYDSDVRLARETLDDSMVTLVATNNRMEFTQDRFFTRLVHEINRSDGRLAIASSTFQVVAPSELAVKVNNTAP